MPDWRLKILFLSSGYSSMELFRINTWEHAVSVPVQGTSYDCGLITIFILLVMYHSAGSFKFSAAVALLILISLSRTYSFYDSVIVM